MQLTSVSSTTGSGKTRGSDAVVSLPSTRAGAAQQAAAPARLTPAAPPRGGLNNWQPQLNQQMAGAQQALHFLDETATQLQGLKFELDGRLAQRHGQASAAQAAVSERVQRLVKLWERRQTASAGTLGPNLAYDAEGGATQRFTVKGLTVQHLQRGEKEMVSLSANAPNSLRGSVSVALEPGLSEAELVKRFDQALAAHQVRVGKGEQGELLFIAPESDWPALRDSLAIRGGGIRFPTGQYHRVQAEAEPDALQPKTWKADDTAAMRQSLQKVLEALDAVRQARASVQNALAREAKALQEAEPAGNEPFWAASFVQKFEDLAQQRSYTTVSEVAAALIGVRRERVLSLLALRD